MLHPLPKLQWENQWATKPQKHWIWVLVYVENIMKIFFLGAPEWFIELSVQLLFSAQIMILGLWD